MKDHSYCVAGTLDLLAESEVAVESASHAAMYLCRAEPCAVGDAQRVLNCFDHHSGVIRRVRIRIAIIPGITFAQVSRVVCAERSRAGTAGQRRQVAEVFERNVACHERVHVIGERCGCVPAG